MEWSTLYKQKHVMYSIECVLVCALHLFCYSVRSIMYIRSCTYVGVFLFVLQSEPPLLRRGNSIQTVRRSGIPQLDQHTAVSYECKRP